MGAALRRVRVLGITQDYPPGSLVGSWLATHRFMAHLAGRGHFVMAAGWRTRSEYVLDGVKVVRGLRGRAPELRNLSRFDVVVSHAGDGGRGHGLARRGGCRSVVMVHGHGYRSIGDPDLAVFNSESLRLASEWDGPSIVCYPPVDPLRTAAPGGGRWVTIVNCTADKGIGTARNVAALMPDREFVGVLGGYGTQEPVTAPNFRCIPTTRDMAGVYAKTRILLMPSSFETWGMVGVEAMCSGIPVIAHPTPGLRESLGDAGIFVDRDDTDGWVEQIRRLDDPGEYAAASAASLARAAELDPQVSLDRFAAAVEALCR